MGFLNTVLAPHLNNMGSKYNLFEYQYKNISQDVMRDIGALESFLDEIWQNRPKSDTSNWRQTELEQQEDLGGGKQRFLRLRSHEISPRNYVGVIKYNDVELNLLPKIFYSKDKTTQSDIKAINLHILYWLSYTKRIRFPKSLSNLDNIEIEDFFEVLIFAFASFTREILNNMLFQNYRDINNDVQFVKGRLDVNGYIKNNITTGHWQRITCEYNSFEVDNRFNRIIKFVSKLLLRHTSNDESQKLLQEIIIILDDVEDLRMTYEDCTKVHLNPFYSDLQAVLDYCRLFLSNSMIFHYKEKFEVFTFLLPMEQIFEEFIVGFMKENFPKESELSDWVIRSQRPQKNLSVQPKAFLMKPDIYLHHENKPTIILDTKYKILRNPTDPKKGVSQGDLYQMVAYAVRYNVNNIILLYPSTIEDLNIEYDSRVFQIDDILGLNAKDSISQQTINVHIEKIPMISSSSNCSYSEIKDDLDNQVMRKLREIISDITSISRKNYSLSGL
jgi:5-methylcytosine-specific restriction enzyme subunit McrC